MPSLSRKDLLWAGLSRMMRRHGRWARAGKGRLIKLSSTFGSVMPLTTVLPGEAARLWEEVVKGQARLWIVKPPNGWVVGKDQKQKMQKLFKI